METRSVVVKSFGRLSISANSKGIINELTIQPLPGQIGMQMYKCVVDMKIHCVLLKLWRSPSHSQ